MLKNCVNITFPDHIDRHFEFLKKKISLVIFFARSAIIRHDFIVVNEKKSRQDQQNA